jgi:hypothetical protein
MLELLTVLLLSDADARAPSIFGDDEGGSAAQCERGAAEACQAFGLSLRQSGNVEGARAAFLRACELGSAEACHRAEAMAAAAGELELAQQLRENREALVENPGTKQLPPPPWRAPRRPAVQRASSPTVETTGRAGSAADGESRSKFGIAGTAAGLFPVTATDGHELAFHAAVGLRYCLFDRATFGWGPNLAVALLAAADIGDRISLGLDGRIEGLYLGRASLTEPIMNLFVQGGFAIPFSGPVEYHAGIGLNFDLLASGLLGGSGGGGGGGGFNIGSLGGGGGYGAAGLLVAAAAILFVMMPSVELRYTARADGSAFGSVIVGIGI